MMQDAKPVCGFFGSRARSSVLGVRSSASDRLRYRVSETRYRVPSNQNPDHFYTAYISEQSPTSHICIMGESRIPGARSSSHRNVPAQKTSTPIMVGGPRECQVPIL